MYLVLLFFVAVTTYALGSAAEVWSVVQQREKERELLFVGNEFLDAIGDYFESTPGGGIAIRPEAMTC